MPVELNGETYYRTAEACRIACISKNTLRRWIRTGLFAEVKHWDRRGWRLFTEDDLEGLKAEANHVSSVKAASKCKDK